MRVSRNPRQIAFEILFEVEFNGQYSNLLLSRTFRDVELPERDKGFVTELVYGTLRQRGRCDGAIARCADRKLSEIDAKVLIVLRLGAYQLLLLNSPAHAAVNETVELAKLVAGQSSGSFVNAIMRKLSSLEKYQFENLEEEYSHPIWIINAFRDALKEESLVFAQLISDNLGGNATLVAWPDRSTVTELVAEGGEPIPRGRNAVRIAKNPGSIAAVRERRAGVQDLGSQLVVERFFETDSGGLRWLDLCAGPGGKAAYLDSLLRNGELVANEISFERMKLVKQVVRNGKVTNFDGRQMPAEVGRFDRILIDAPCTGLGALRRRPEIKWRRQPDDLPGLIALQQDLLSSAAKLLKPGGIIGYATCSPHLAETKWQVRSFLKSHPQFNRLAVTKDQDPDGDMQLWTFRDDTDSMFLSLLRYAP